jgi:prolyl oligopeptidase PreP (S9A serine peptidase family)
VIRGLTVIDDRLLVHELCDANSRLRLLRIDGTPDGEIDLPETGSVSTSGAIDWFQSLGSSAVSLGPDGFAFVHSSYDKPPTLSWYSLKDREVRTIIDPRTSPCDLSVAAESFPAEDGVAVPTRIVSRPDATRPAPAIIYCYGAYNFATVPSWIGPLGSTQSLKA